MSLSGGEKRLLSLLTEYAGDLMSRCGCNDLTKEMERCLTDEEWNQLSYEFDMWNSGNPDDQTNLFGCDWAVFKFLVKKALKNG
jgi:hypothetical protein